MNFQPIFTDFEKRYGKKCDRAYFIGKPIILLKAGCAVLGTAVSSGGFLSCSARNDGKFLIQFSKSRKMLNCNILNLADNKDEKIFSMFLRLQHCGVRLIGAQMLLSDVSSLIMHEETILLTAANAFCENPPKPQELLARFENFETNMLASFSRRNTVLLLSGSSLEYLPFPESAVKIILCYPQEPTENMAHILRLRDDYTRDTACEDHIISDACTFLRSGDYADFGKTLTRFWDGISRKKGTSKKTLHLFNIAKNSNDAYGCGLLSDGGIFALVKDASVDTFMHNLRFEYERTLGGELRFYVTRSEDSPVSKEP